MKVKLILTGTKTITIKTYKCFCPECNTEYSGNIYPDENNFLIKCIKCKTAFVAIYENNN
jgi:hypothetical protein